MLDRCRGVVIAGGAKSGLCGLPGMEEEVIRRHGFFRGVKEAR